jgi:pimeloyl-ACP methyl ester carboxylesterase
VIEPFEVSVPAKALADLRRRLGATRWPVGVTDGGGLPRERADAVIRYWREEFDWRRQELRINAFRHFRATVGGLRIHFLHERAAVGDAAPLLLLHGWPGSFLEMLGVVPLLRESFHLVVPSLPGYGFSEPPSAPGISNERMADLFAELMSLLGYERFGVQGGDWGAGIATWMARKHPARLLGMHLNYVPGSYAPHVEGELAPEESVFLRESDAWVAESGAYGQVQRTRPLTLAYALADSPAGLAAWIVEKFDEWADPASELPLDDLLANVTLYWVTNTIGSSMRLYLESSRTPLRFGPGERLAVPCGVARFPLEAPFPPRRWVERVYDVRRWTEMPRGGHFAALEAPDLFAADVAVFFRSIQQGRTEEDFR